MTKAVVSKRTVVPDIPKITSFEDVHSTGYQLVLWKDLSDGNIFKQSEPGSTFHNIHKSFLEKPWSVVTSVEEMVSVLLTRPNTIGFDSTTTVLESEDLMVLPQYNLDKAPLSFSCRKNLGLKEELDKQILKLWEEGLMSALAKKWFRKTKEPSRRADTNSIEAKDIFILWLIICIGILMSFIVGLFEVLHQNHIGRSCAS